MSASERIAIVSTSYPASVGDPSGHFVATEAHRLSRAGHSVTVLTGGTARSPFENDENPRVVRLWDGGATGWPGLVSRLKQRPTRAFGLAVWGATLRRELVRRGPFERVIAHWLLPTAFPFLSRLDLTGARLELVVHGSDARLLATLPKVLSRNVLRGLSRRATFRCVSRDLARLLCELADAPLAGRLYVEPAPIDVSEAPTRDQARAKLALPGSARLIVIVSRLVPGKRVDDALAAAALLPEVRLVVLGDGPELTRLRAAHPHAHFAGRVARTDALIWIAAADAVLSASRLEGAPSALREARSLGVPVVTTAAGDLALWAEADPELWVVE